MRFKHLCVLSLILSFSPLLSADVSTAKSDCYLNVTLIAESSYFIEKAFDQWKSDSQLTPQISCAEGGANYPVQVQLTGKGFAYGFSNTSKIRLSILIPKAKIENLFNRSLNVSLKDKQFTVESYYDYLQLENIEIHIENSLSENEIKSISQALLLIERASVAK